MNVGLKGIFLGLCFFAITHALPPKSASSLSKVYVQSLQFSPQAQLKAQLSKTGLTRLAVEGDRVASLFVETGMLTQVADEASGQWFIQPAHPERKQPIALSVITSGGHTQDMELTITDVPSAAIRLRVPPTVTKAPVDTSRAQAREEKPLMLLKAVMQEQVAPHPQRTVMPRKNRPKHVTLRYHNEYHLDGYRISQWRVVNQSGRPLTFEEGAFYESGDIALTLTQHHVAPHQASRLLIMRGGL